MEMFTVPSVKPVSLHDIQKGQGRREFRKTSLAIYFQHFIETYAMCSHYFNEQVAVRPVIR